MANIDDIYDMLSWDNDEATQQKGIEAAREIRSLWVFILPILSSNSKSIWENCAKILSSRSNGELKPYLSNLFTWLRDMNWPGAEMIFDRLLLIPYAELETDLSISLSLAEKNNDTPWKSTLTAFKSCFEEL